MKLIIIFLLFILRLIVIGCNNYDSMNGKNYEDRSKCWCVNVTNQYNNNINVLCKCHNQQLTYIPNNLSKHVDKLIIRDTSLETLEKDALTVYASSLKDLTLTNLKIFREIEGGAFNNLLQLRTIYIHDAPQLTTISSTVFHLSLPKLKILRIVHTGLTHVPHFHNLKITHPLHMIDLDNNQITRIDTRSVMIQVEYMSLNHNPMTEIQDSAFENSHIAKLSLKGNRQLSKLHDNTFIGVQSLRYLDLSASSITNLPTKGLEDLEILKLEEIFSLQVFPSIYDFLQIEEASLTYPYHCCAFHYPATHDPTKHATYQESVKKLMENCHQHNVDKINDINGSNIRSTAIIVNDQNLPDNYFHSQDVTVNPETNVICGNISKNYRAVRCQPIPDAFNPCEDLMGNWALRVAVWLVALAALLGNTAVLVVLLSSRFRMTVPKFLMCNLAVADFFMGVYLLMIAIMDATSIGSYFNHAIYWQRGLGCKVAGFFTVFSCVLSVFTLVVITSERLYTITYAIHLNKRLKLSEAAKIMTVGWSYSLLTAALPLFGISGYHKTSICLPMQNSQKSDEMYLLALLLFDGLAFWIICACYAKMYCAIRGGRESVASIARSDMTVAKRMALLVFTDFACWAPVAFFGLTALFGYPLIDVPKSKILLVFFYPLNSCANPYLYALLTQQYRRDLFTLLSRYGICAERAAVYKGAPTHGIDGRVMVENRQAIGPNNSREDDVNKMENDANHRGSVLTTSTSIDYSNNKKRNSNQIELQSLNYVGNNNTFNNNNMNPDYETVTDNNQTSTI